MNAADAEALEADFIATPDPLVRAAGLARLSRRSVDRAEMARRVWREIAAGGMPVTIIADAAVGLVVNGVPGADAAYREALDQAAPLVAEPAFGVLGSILELVAPDEQARYWKEAATGAPKDALKRLLAVARAMTPGMRQQLRDVVTGMELAPFSTDSAFMLLLIAGADGHPDFPGAQTAIDVLLEPSKRNTEFLPLKQVVAVAGITSGHVASFFTARNDVPVRIRGIVTGGKAEADFIGLRLLSIAIDRDDDALRKLFELSWKIPTDDERRRALVGCLEATARSAQPERFVDDVVRRVGEPGIGPYFRTEIAGGILRALSSSAPSVAGPRVSSTASIFMEMFPNTSGDVAFACLAVARLADRLFDWSRGDAVSLASALLPWLNTPSTTHWTAWYRSASRFVVGDIFCRGGDRARGRTLIDEALGIEGDGLDLVDVLREAIYRTSRYEEKGWTPRLLASVSRVEFPRVRVALAQAMVDAAFEPPASAESIRL